MGIIDDFLNYYESSVAYYKWYKSLSDQTVLSKKTSEGNVTTRFPDNSSLERKMSEFNLKDQLNEKPIEHNDPDRIFPLDSGLKNQFEFVYAVNFEQVMIHLGATADQIARDHGAAAVTQGNDIYFHSDQYAPHTQEGQMLLAHELQHVQQFQSGQSMNAIEDIKHLEDHASGSENLLSQLNLHSLTRPVLSRDPQTGLEELEANLTSSQNGSGSQSDAAGGDESLESFSGRTNQINYRIHLDSGKYYDFSPAEYEELLDRLKEKMCEYLDEKIYVLGEAQFVDFIQKVSDEMGWSVI